MSIYQQIVFPVLKRLDAERAHDWTGAALGLAQTNALGLGVLRRIGGGNERCPVRVFGLEFPNVLGVAAGFDKNAKLARGLAALGFGHVEVGTLTPQAQVGNPRPRIFRIPEECAVINRMGFPNEGIEAVLPRLRALKGRDFILGVSLGKQKTTDLERAAQDYRLLMRGVYALADYMAINISSPNTPGLRQLQGRQYLMELLGELMKVRGELAGEHGGVQKAVLVKIAPDLSDKELDEILECLNATGVDGIIATNTTLSRAGVERHAAAAQTGGLSGRPLTAASTELIRKIHARTGGKPPIVGAGGIFTSEDARRKLDAGATLLQVYTGMIYEGPAIARKILSGL